MKERRLEEAGLTFYPERLEIRFQDQMTTVSKKEADILEMILERFPKVAGRDDLLEKLWDDQTFVDENTLNVNITRVRKKLLEIGIKDAIETVRGVGYRLHVNW
jgi:DNA-binding response OmpR family regulator